MDLGAVAMGLVFSLMWSSAFATGRILVQDAAPLHMLAARFLISGLIAVALARAMGQTWRLTRAQGRAVLVFGLCQNALYLGLNFVALQWVAASLAVIIAATMPLLVAGLGWILGTERIGRLGLAGLIAGFAGVALIMATRVEGGANLWGVLLCALGALALATATLTLRGAASGGNMVMVVGLQMLVGSAALAVVAALAEPARLSPTPEFFAAFAYQIIVPGLAATMVWFALVGRIGAVRAATFHFLNPFFGVLIAAILLHEPVGLTDGLGVLIVAGGILAVQLSRAQIKASSST